MMDNAGATQQHAEGKLRPGASFFSCWEWSAFWTATLLCFAVYFYTLAPTVTLEDSGEFAVAGDYLGVPHPPGYPSWTVLAWIFARVFSFVTFRGQPNPAWAMNLLSAVCGAFAAGVAAMLVCRSGRDLLRQSWRSEHGKEEGKEHAICCICGVVSSLLFAFSPAMWSQSVIVEAYSLNALFLLLVFLLTYWWLCRPSDTLLYVAAFVFGLGLTNYQVLLLAALPLAFAVFLRDPKLFRDFLITGLPYLVVIGMMQRGYLHPISHPLNASGFIYLTLNAVAMLMAWFLLPRGRTVALTFLLAQLGVAFYAVMPIVSDLRNPPMNWGYPRTWEGFKHAITRGQYEKIAPTDVFSGRFIDQIIDYLIDLRMQFTLLTAPLAILPFAVWQVQLGKRRFYALKAACWLIVAAVLMAMGEKFIFGPGSADEIAYKLLFLSAFLLGAAGFAAILIAQAKELFVRMAGKADAAVSERLAIAGIFGGLTVMFLAYAVILIGKFREVTAPLRDAGAQLATGQGETLMLQGLGLLALIMGPIVLFALIAWLMHSRHRFEVTIDPQSQKWVIATFLGFIVMSVLLIVLANPKGDIQDAFIQRVKFISSHALYALWIGYGLIFGLAFVDTLFRGNRMIKWAGFGVACLLPLVPLHENAYNEELVRIVGGAEQHGHDFGWQFGNYQLRGAEAILEELDPDEEPLPNPFYPPEMTQDAIFYGGTDPGRFVPTYMIYSARVREDVYLITQNALADNTYMNVMRDLYGDQIWIPAQIDSTRAFQIYVDEVQSGKRQRNADLRIEEGRVQVSGVLGVMEINGILAEMIFEKNKYRHDFYVEESYVIRWMYPYLTPHGLIMKINDERTPLKGSMIRDDHDFWDWYTRRLAGDPKFRRDVVARKSFSKLRSAIGGLYANPHARRYEDAEIAYQQARMLYPLSPEANFRLVQEIYMPQGRFEKARDVMIDFGQQDPGNANVPNFLRQLDGLVELYRRIGDLEQKRDSGKMEAPDAIRLADLYLQAQQRMQFLNVITGILNTPNLPVQFYYQAAQLLSRSGNKEQMNQAIQMTLERLPQDAPPQILLDLARMHGEAQQPQPMLGVMSRYLQLRPQDWRAWLDMAAVYVQLQDRDGASNSLNQAIRHGGREAMNIIQQDPRFAPFRRAQAGPGPSGGGSVLDLPGITPGSRR